MCTIIFNYNIYLFDMNSIYNSINLVMKNINLPLIHLLFT